MSGWSDFKEIDALRAEERVKTQQFFDMIVIGVNTIFTLNDEMAPCVFAETKEGDWEFIPASGGSKEEWIGMVKEHLSEARCTRCVLATETWYVIKTPDKEREDFPDDLSKAPGVRECIIINAEDRYGNFIYSHLEINRDSKGKPSLGKLLILPEDLTSKGEMVRLLAE